MTNIFFNFPLSTANLTIFRSVTLPVFNIILYLSFMLNRLKIPRFIAIFFFFAIAVPLKSAEGFDWVQLGVDGLTCSQCTRSVEMSIRKLDFVEDVQMNLEHTEGKVVFKKGAKVDIEKIAKAVVDAGFSVRYLKAGFTFENTAAESNNCFSYGGVQYQFVNVTPRTLSGETIITFLGDKFLSKKESKKWKPSLTVSCADKKQKVYFITL